MKDHNEETLGELAIWIILFAGWLLALFAMSGCADDEGTVDANEPDAVELDASTPDAVLYPDADTVSCFQDGCCETCCMPSNLDSANCCYGPLPADPSIIRDPVHCDWWPSYSDAGVEDAAP